jgi:hypothetical protein
MEEMLNYFFIYRGSEAEFKSKLCQISLYLQLEMIYLWKMKPTQYTLITGFVHVLLVLRFCSFCSCLSHRVLNLPPFI